MPDHQVNDLRKGMKALIRPLMATGYAKQTIYYRNLEGNKQVCNWGCLKSVLEIGHYASHHPSAEIQVWPTLEHET